MSKKDFIAIAAIIEHNATASNDEPRESGERVETIAREMADYLAAENPRFDRERFLEACGVSA